MKRSTHLRPDHCSTQPSSLGRAVSRGIAALAVLVMVGAGPALAIEGPNSEATGKAERIDTLRSLLALQYPHLRSVAETETPAGITGPEAGATRTTTSPSL